MPVDLPPVGTILAVLTGYFLLRYETLHEFIPYFYGVFRNMLLRLCNLSVAKVLRNGVQWRSVLLKIFFESSVRKKKFVSLLYQIITNNS